MMPPRQGWEALQERLLFLPPLPEQLDPLALFALLLVAGLLVGETLFRRFGLSRIVGYVLAGAVAGPGVLGWLDRETVALAKPVADAALGLLPGPPHSPIITAESPAFSCGYRHPRPPACA